MSSLEEEYKQSEKKRLLSEQRRQVAETGVQQLDDLRRTLPLVLDGKALETASRVLEMCATHIKTTVNFNDYDHRLRLVQEAVNHNTKEQDITSAAVDRLEQQLEKVVALLRKYVEDNRQAVDALNQYLQNWM